jgi:hypothetical protein
MYVTGTAASNNTAAVPKSTLTAQRSLRNRVVGAGNASDSAATSGVFDDSRLKVHSGGASSAADTLAMDMPSMELISRFFVAATDKRTVTKTPPPQIVEELKRT